MMTAMEWWAGVALTTLASFRITRLFHRDHLFTGLVRNTQEWFEARKETRTGSASPDEWQSQIAYLLSCVWCLNVWTAGVLTAACAFTVGVEYPWLVWPAAAGLAGLLDRADTGA